jgi:hypothetical protein
VPFANGTPARHPAHAGLLEGIRAAPKFDTQKLRQLRGLTSRASTRSWSKFTSPANERVDSDILIFQVPGGMLSNFRNQLKEQGMADKFDEVVREIPVVREALGWIPLVTPTSQIVGTQAMMNVKFGRWKMICQPARTSRSASTAARPARLIPACWPRSKSRPARNRVTDRPADLLEPGMEKYRKQCAEKGLPTDDETVVLFAMFPQQVEALYKTSAKAAAAAAPASVPAAAAAPAARIRIGSVESGPLREWPSVLTLTRQRQTPRCGGRNPGRLNRKPPRTMSSVPQALPQPRTLARRVPAGQPRNLESPGGSGAQGCALRQADVLVHVRGHHASTASTAARTSPKLTHLDSLPGSGPFVRGSSASGVVGSCLGSFPGDRDAGCGRISTTPHDPTWNGA